MSDRRENRILILFAHPGFRNSRVNRVLRDAVHALDGITFHDLYEAYPELDIDVAREQNLVDAHDIIIFQHPFFWYSTPAILKEWQDLVLEHGWAYGTGCTALHGKRFMGALTTGGQMDAYREGGFNRFTMRQLLAPLEQTVYLCGMHYLPPFVVHGTHRNTEEETREHARDYARLLEALRDDQVDLAAAGELNRINENLDRIIKPKAKSE